MSNFLTELKLHIKTFLSVDVIPFFKSFLSTVVENEVTALRPIVANAVASETTALVTAAASGSLSGLAAASANVLTKAAQEAEVSGVTAGISSLLATVSATISAHPAVVAGTTAPAIAGTDATSESAI